MRGRHVLVTGGSRGIGEAVVRSLAVEGAHVHVLSRDPSSVRGVAERSGGGVWPADLTDDADVWTQLDGLVDRLGGPPDALVHAAGTFSLAPIAETSVEAFDREIDVNLRGAFLVVRALLPAFLERGHGRIVLVGSVAGHRAFPENGAYSASKYGLRGFFDVLFEELRGTGVAATLIEPAATDTAIWDPFDPDGDPRLPDRATMLEAADVARAVSFVLGEPAQVRIPLLRIERG